MRHLGSCKLRYFRAHGREHSCEVREAGAAFDLPSERPATCSEEGVEFDDEASQEAQRKTCEADDSGVRRRGTSGDRWTRDLSVAHKQYAHDAIAGWKHKEAVKAELEELASLEWVCHNAIACPDCSEVLGKIVGALSSRDSCVAEEVASRNAPGDEAAEDEAASDADD